MYSHSLKRSEKIASIDVIVMMMRTKEFFVIDSAVLEL